MKIVVDKNNGLIKWSYDNKEIEVQNFNVMYAWKHEDSMVMIKIKNKNGEVGFIIYDISGEFILSYVEGDNKLIIGNNKCVQLDTIISIDYSKKDKKIVALVNSSVDGEKLVILNSDGEILSKIPNPLGYKYYFIKNDGNNIVAVCQGLSDLSADKYGRNDWNFRVDLENYYVEKISITQ